MMQDLELKIGCFYEKLSGTSCCLQAPIRIYYCFYSIKLLNFYGVVMEFLVRKTFFSRHGDCFIAEFLWQLSDFGMVLGGLDLAAIDSISFNF